MATQGPAPVNTGTVPVVIRPLDRSPAPVPPGPGTTGQIPTVTTPQGPPESAPPSVTPGPGTGQTTSTSTVTVVPVIEIPVDTGNTSGSGTSTPNITVPNLIEVLADGVIIIRDASALNFTGPGVTATANGAVATLTITSGSTYGNSNVGNLLSNYGSNTISTTGNITGGYLFGNGSQLSGIVTGYGNANVAVYLASGTDTANIITTANISGQYILGNGSQLTGLPAAYGNANVVANLAALGTNPVSTVGNITGGNLIASAVIVATVSASANITGNYILGNGSHLTGLPATYGNANVVANLAALGTNPVSTIGNITGGYLFGNGSQLTGLPAAYGNANVVANLAALGSNPVSTTGNITGGNLLTGGLINATGNITGGNLLTGGLINATGNITGGNLSAVNLVINNIRSDDSSFVNIEDGVNITGDIVASGNIIGAAANIPSIVSQNLDVENISARGAAGVNIGAGGFNNLVVEQTRVLIQNVPLSVSGNITGSYLFGNGSQLTGLPATYGNANVAANLAAFADNPILTTGNVGAGNINVTTATGNLVFGRASATGSPGINSTSSVTVVANRFGTPTEWVFTTDGSFTGLGNISGGNVNTGKVANTGNLSLSAGANSWTFDTTGNLTVPGSIILPPNSLITSVGASPAPRLDNFDSVGAVNLSASGNVTSVTVSASGNVTGGNVNTNTLVGTGTTIKSTGALNLSATGNIVVNSTYINNLSDPVQNQDAATKNYVDTVAQGLNIHQAANLASTQDLATYTGATVTYDNGTSGVGATLSLVGNTLTTLDGTAIPVDASTRLLIKNQANAVLNGVYNYTSSSLLTRSTDMDDTAGLAGGDFLFVTSGATQADTGWIQTTDNVVVGTNNVVFSQFSSAGAYTANTSAGLALNGSIFSAKVDGVTTAFDGGGNIIVKASANLTTPNIGTATGSSLSTTGNVTGGNLITSAAVSAASVSASGNITGGNLNTAGQIISTQTGNSDTGAGQLYLNGAGNNRIDFNTNGTGAPAFTTRSAGTKIALYPAISGSAVDYALGVEAGALWTSIPGPDGGQYFKWYGGTTQVGYLSGAGVFSVTGNVYGGNIITAADVSAASVIASGNVTGGNLNAAGLSLSGNVVSALVSAANITTTANISGGYILGNGSQLTGIATGTPTQIVSGTSNVSVVSSSGNVTVSVGGTSNVVVIASTGSYTTGVALATGNVAGANINTTGIVSASANVIGSNLVTSGTVYTNTNGGGLLSTTLTTSTYNIYTQNPSAAASKTINVGTGATISNSTTAINLGSQFGISNTTVYGNLIVANTLTSLSTGSASFLGNINTSANVSATGNVTGGNIITAAAVSAASVSASGNITGGNLRSTSLSLSGNVISVLNASSSIAAGTTISAVGNVTGGNVTTAGLTSTASLSITGNTATVTSANYSIGYLTIPQVTLSANATAGLTDIGKHFYSTTAGNLQITIPDNANVAFPIGTALSVVVQAGGNVLVVTQPSTTLYLSGNATSGNRVVGSYGMATIMKVASGTWFISGTGVS